MGDEKEQVKNSESLAAETVQEQPVDPMLDEDYVSIKDRALAFIILVLPWSALLVFLQEQLQDVFKKSITNIVLLIGIVSFLFCVGWLSRKIKAYREQRQSANP